MANRIRTASVIVILAIGLLVRVGFLVGAGEDSLVTVVTDDAFYYFKTARNIVAGHGSTFDGIHPTNGYHPLWMALAVPVVPLAPEPLSLVRVALGLSVVFSFLTALFLYLVLRRVTDLWYVPALGLILYFLNPRSAVSSLNGLETALSTLLFTVLLWLIFSEAQGTVGRAGMHALLGLLLGLLFLARTDNVFFMAAFYVAAILLGGKEVRLRRALVMGTVATLAVLPWLAWSWAKFGSPVQVSGLSIPYVEQELYRLDGHTAADAIGHGLKRFAAFLMEGLRGELGYSRLVSFPAIAVSLLLLARRWRGLSAPVRRAFLILLALGVASLAQVFVHTAVRWYPRPWYFDQLLVLLPLFFALALAVLATAWAALRTRAAQWLVGAALVGVAAFQTTMSVQTLSKGEWPWAKQMLDAARWLRENTKEGEVAAAFNAGIIGYFSERPVVNLDGAINNAAYAALRRKHLLRFMRQASVRHYLDFDPVVLEHFGPFLPKSDLGKGVEVQPVKEMNRPDAQWAGNSIRIYRLEWPREGTKEE
jgi:hypothetical protein